MFCNVELKSDIKDNFKKPFLILFYEDGMIMKYVKSTDEEYILDDGENIMYIRGKLQDVKKEALKAAEKSKRVVTINKTVGFIDPD